MKICNCHKDLHAYLCDIPFEWRVGIVKALCLIFEQQPDLCKWVKDCETLTFMSGFRFQGNNLIIEYRDEDGLLTGEDADILWEGEAMTHDQYYTEYECDDESGEDNHEEIIQEYIDFYEELEPMPTIEYLNNYSTSHI